MTTTTERYNGWNSYENEIADCQIKKYGRCFLDKFNRPIDDEDKVEELYLLYMMVEEPKEEN